MEAATHRSGRARLAIAFALGFVTLGTTGCGGNGAGGPLLGLPGAAGIPGQIAGAGATGAAVPPAAIPLGGTVAAPLPASGSNGVTVIAAGTAGATATASAGGAGGILPVPVLIPLPGQTPVPASTPVPPPPPAPLNPLAPTSTPVPVATPVPAPTPEPAPTPVPTAPAPQVSITIINIGIEAGVDIPADQPFTALEQNTLLLALSKKIDIQNTRITNLNAQRADAQAKVDQWSLGGLVGPSDADRQAAAAQVTAIDQQIAQIQSQISTLQSDYNIVQSAQPQS